MDPLIEIELNMGLASAWENPKNSKFNKAWLNAVDKLVFGRRPVLWNAACENGGLIFAAPRLQVLRFSALARLAVEFMPLTGAAIYDHVYLT